MKLNELGVSSVYVSTISKIEAGDRAVDMDELVAFADIFSVTVDELMGRSPAGNDLLLSISRLTSMAQKISAEVSMMYRRFDDEIQDLRHYSIGNPDTVTDLLQSAAWALELLKQSHDSMDDIADEFPLTRKNAHITSGSMHRRISRINGPAKSYPCAECGKPACDWSYDYKDLNEIQSEYGPYSLELGHYQPRCRSCHLKFDIKMQHKK